MMGVVVLLVLENILKKRIYRHKVIFFNQFTHLSCIINTNKGCYCSAHYKKPLNSSTHRHIHMNAHKKGFS